MSDPSLPRPDPELQAFLERFRLASPTGMDDLAARSAASIGESPIRRAAKGGIEPLVEWDHYPKGDIYDHGSHSQYFYHAHPTELRGGEHGH
ncbi:MAG: hypothetical protein IH973_13595, partial [Myxococcales bacterium]|nr:hypothetical protein [Myxococcales bacterium]